VVYGEALGDSEDDEEDSGGEGEEDGLRCWRRAVVSGSHQALALWRTIA
jgi:hypothetical protein